MLWLVMRTQSSLAATAAAAVAAAGRALLLRQRVPSGWQCWRGAGGCVSMLTVHTASCSLCLLGRRWQGCASVMLRSQCMRPLQLWLWE
jgi:hypothetical protein